MADRPAANTDADKKQFAKASVVIGESLTDQQPLAAGKLNSPFGVAEAGAKSLLIVFTPFQVKTPLFEVESVANGNIPSNNDSVANSDLFSNADPFQATC